MLRQTVRLVRLPPCREPRRGDRFAAGWPRLAGAKIHVVGESWRAGLSYRRNPGRQMLGESPVKIGPPEAEYKIGGYDYNQQCQNSIPLSANALKLRPDRFGLYQDDQDK